MSPSERNSQTSRLPKPQDTDHEPRATRDEGRATSCCRHCVYARRPVGRWLRVILSRWPGLLICTNHPDAPGDILGVPACSQCPNFRPRPLPIERPDVPNPVGPLVCTIPLTRRKVAMVDPQDYERVSACKWCANRIGNQWYAQRRVHGKTIRMHQFIMDPPKGMVVDHINGNGLDNQRDNLRICTKLQNAWNKKRRKQEDASTQFIGVYRYKKSPGRCYVKVQCNGETTNLGPFDDEVEAARVRDRKAIELFGPYAMLNFPEEREQRVQEIEAERCRTDGGGQTV